MNLKMKIWLLVVLMLLKVIFLWNTDYSLFILIPNITIPFFIIILMSIRVLNSHIILAKYRNKTKLPIDRSIQEEPMVSKKEDEVFDKKELQQFLTGIVFLVIFTNVLEYFYYGSPLSINVILSNAILIIVCYTIVMVIIHFSFKIIRTNLFEIYRLLSIRDKEVL